MSFASGKHSLAICGRCDEAVPYLSLRDQIFNRVPTGLRVCPDCFDKDNEQLWRGEVNARPEGIALENARPDSWDRFYSVQYFAWNPTTQFLSRGILGRATVGSS